jgi:hypothetical protein
MSDDRRAVVAVREAHVGPAAAAAGVTGLSRFREAAIVRRHRRSEGDIEDDADDADDEKLDELEDEEEEGRQDDDETIRRWTR